LKKKSHTASVGFFGWFHRLLFGYTIVAYLLCYFVPTSHWLAGFIMLSVPVVMVLHAVLGLWFLLFNPRAARLSVVALLLSFPFWNRTNPLLRTAWRTVQKPATTPPQNKTLTVMSYNVASFDVLRHLDNIEPQNALDLIAWAKNAEADIKCFQEFYTHKVRPNFVLLPQFKKAGYPYYTLRHPKVAPNEENFMGLAIVSKFPIVARGEQEFENQNGILWADLKIKNDTIRVVNVHLRSMIVRFGGLKEAYQNRDYKKGKQESRWVASRLKYGFEHHAEEIKIITACIDSSPYPVMVCGDFNETPYSYAYGQMRQRLRNAFEDAGTGFGFSYRDTPRFIRIDNQFYDPNAFAIEDFKTRRDVIYSDHFPIFGRYKMKF
jgi:endonuclease/exonuclease/phosphatase (EEP) superfamily protein YafD